MPLLIAVLCLVWGSTWWAIRVCLEDQPPLSSAALRFLVAGAGVGLGLLLVLFPTAARAVDDVVLPRSSEKANS